MFILTGTWMLMPWFDGTATYVNPSAGPARPVWFPGYARPDARTLNTQQARAAKLARAHLEKAAGEPVDAYYRATVTDGGFSVHVKYVTGYDKAEEPVFIPGGHCTVVISKGWSVVEVLPGA